MPLELTPDTYVQDFADDARVLGEAAPDIPLVGPAVAHPRVGLPFITTLIEAERPELGAVSAHLYPYSQCIRNPRSPSYRDRPPAAESSRGSRVQHGHRRCGHGGAREPA